MSFNSKKRGFERVAWSLNKTDFKMPERATKNSAGYDFYYNGDTPIHICPTGLSVLIPTGVKAYMLPDEVLQIHMRSSLGIKRNLQLANTTGVIDSDYYNNPDNEGEIFVKIRNLDAKDVQTILHGDKIAQGVFIKYLIADNDNAQKERTSGIGSTGG